jgi:hypothetical protein
MKTIEVVAQRACIPNSFASVVRNIMSLAELAEAEDVLHGTDEEWADVDRLLKSAGSTNTGRSSTKLRRLLESQPFDVLVKLRMLVDVSQDLDFDSTLYGEQTPELTARIVESLCQSGKLQNHLSLGIHLVKKRGGDIEANWVYH